MRGEEASWQHYLCPDARATLKKALRFLQKTGDSLITPDTAAAAILRAASGGGSVYVPGKWMPIMGIIGAIPSRIFRKLNL